MFTTSRPQCIIRHLSLRKGYLQRIISELNSLAHTEHISTGIHTEYHAVFVPIKAGPRYSANGFIEKAGRSTKGTLANVIVSPPCFARDSFGADARLPPSRTSLHKGSRFQTTAWASLL